MIKTFISIAMIGLVPWRLFAQLTISVSPDPNRVAPHSRIDFSATVPKHPPNASALVRYVVRLCPPGSETTPSCDAKWSSVSKDPGNGAGSVTLSFNSYTVPSGVRAGDMFCFALEKFYAKVATISIAPPSVIDHECKTVAVMNAVASGHAGPAVATPPTVPAPSASRLSIPAAPLPDLVLEFIAYPKQKWIVRNIGKARAPATIVRFGRSNPKMAFETAVSALDPGATFEIAFKPPLQAYLFNAFAMVDPNSAIKEADKKNNIWSSSH